METYLKEIIESMCENELNIGNTARALNYHRNSVTYSIKKIERETGLNCKKFSDATKLLAMIHSGQL